MTPSVFEGSAPLTVVVSFADAEPPKCSFTWRVPETPCCPEPGKPSTRFPEERSAAVQDTVRFLVRPLGTVTLVSTMKVAVRARRRRYDIKNYLAEREQKCGGLGFCRTFFRTVASRFAVSIPRP